MDPHGGNALDKCLSKSPMCARNTTRNTCSIERHGRIIKTSRLGNWDLFILETMQNEQRHANGANLVNSVVLVLQVFDAV